MRDRSRKSEICDSLDLIASESRRCGDLVKNLLTFSRTTPMNLQPTDLNQVIDRSMRFVQHQLDLAGTQVQQQLDPDLPLVLCDGAQIEQVLLALIMNAMDAMPQGGNLWLTTRLETRYGHSTHRRAGRRSWNSGRHSATYLRAFSDDQGNRARRRAGTRDQPEHS